LLSLKKQNITKWIVFLPAFAILLTFSITLTIIISAERAEYQKSLENTRIAYVKRSKAQAQERVDKLIEYIDENEKFLMNEAKDEIKNIVNLAYQIINDIYTENPNLPREKILEKIKTKLRDTRFFNDLSGYYYIFDFQGICVMHGANKELEGHNLLNLHDENAKNFIHNAIERFKTEDAFSLIWDWKILKILLPVKK
jgi:signal transduction histidine kinase